MYKIFKEQEKYRIYKNKTLPEDIKEYLNNWQIWFYLKTQLYKGNNFIKTIYIFNSFPI